MRLGILVSHPIQYYSPLFRELAKRVDLQVFYATRGSSKQQADAGFGVEFEWDIDLLTGYAHAFLNNVAANPGPSSFFGCDTPEIRDLIRDGNFDAFIVFGWYLKSHWQAICACRRYKVPVLVRGDSQLPANPAGFRKLAKEVTHRLALRQFDGFLSVGKRNREYLLHYGVPEKRIFFSPHFVDNDWFAARALAAKGTRAELRHAWGAEGGSFVVLFAGKFISKKRPLDLVKALGLLHGREVKLTAVFVGSGELQPQMQRLVTKLGIPAHFAGFRNQSEMPQYYAAADVLVLPSDGTETWGLVVNEAMACGLPAIGSDAVGCGPDLIEVGRTGFLFPMGDIAGLANCVERMVRLKEDGVDFSAPSRERIAHYSVHAAAGGMLQAVEELAS